MIAASLCREGGQSGSMIINIEKDVVQAVVTKGNAPVVGSCSFDRNESMIAVKIRDTEIEQL
jgi:hypothetical protein